MAPRDEEPVGYLGGDVEATDKNPYGSDEGEEVVGYLEGQSGQEELPLLPPQESQADYSAKDFIQPEEPQEEQQDPYQDYEAAAEADPSYFDSMGHDSGAATAEEPVEEAQEGDDQPKTISQQDAESIIRRITTKRIEPAQIESRPMPQAYSAPMTRSGGGFRFGALLLILGSILGLGVVAVALFGNEIGKFAHEQGYPEIASMLGYVPPPAVDPVKVDTKDPELVKKEKMLELLQRSETIAITGKPPAATPPGGAKPPAPPGGTPQTPPGGG